MSTYVLVPGAGGSAWFWHLLVPELEARGHEVIAVDLPAADESAGLTEYADTIVEAIGDRTEVILVAQSMGGLSAPLVCTRVPVALLVLLNAMVPVPGETGGAWWANTGQAQAMAEQAAREGRELPAKFDPEDCFFHDVAPEVTAEALARGEDSQSDRAFQEPWPLEKWPDTPTVFLQGRDDRLFPLPFQRRVVRERLNIPVDDMPGGHLVALSRPKELADRLEAYRIRHTGPNVS
ncbi:alpha/beta hydrolase [Actinomadura sp. NPDC048394]|jgi:pimeloyl-ACP methyl ester carboxylesterase|uniref:alpha/beta fold hydrolase n=1 Tax=Actinomadura sp. NPDC048394 TaxID=3158223 RepID=UPI0033EC7442